jgi:hypothetical protein
MMYAIDFIASLFPALSTAKKPTVEVFVSVIGPAYTAEFVVGVEPSVV